MTTKDTNMRTVKALLKLVDAHQLDYLEVGNIKISKSKHYLIPPEAIDKDTRKKIEQALPTSMDDIAVSNEELWFYDPSSKDF